MSFLFPLRHLHHQMLQHLYTAVFVKQCQSVGSKLVVKGPFRIKNSGLILIGDSCIIDSTKEARIRLDVGSQAVLKMGNQVYLNEGVHITCDIAVTIGNCCLIASDVVIMDDDGHPLESKNRRDYWPKTPEDRLQRSVGAPIDIADNVWIGTRSIILKGVTIGEGSVIAAGAVVTRSIPPKVLAAGVPARVIKTI